MSQDLISNRLSESSLWPSPVGVSCEGMFPSEGAPYQRTERVGCGYTERAPAPLEEPFSPNSCSHLVTTTWSIGRIDEVQRRLFRLTLRSFLLSGSLVSMYFFVNYRCLQKQPLNAETVLQVSRSSPLRCDRCVVTRNEYC